MKPAWRIPVLSRLKVRSQIALVFCLAIVFPVLLLGFFTMRQTVEILYDRAYQQLESDNNQARSVLLDATVNFYTISSELVQDASLQAILQQDFAGPKEARAAAGSYSRLESTMMKQPGHFLHPGVYGKPGLRGQWICVEGQRGPGGGVV